MCRGVPGDLRCLWGTGHGGDPHSSAAVCLACVCGTRPQGAVGDGASGSSGAGVRTDPQEMIMIKSKVDIVDDTEALSEEMKIRMQPSLKAAVAAAAAAWQRAPGQRPMTAAEWARMALAEALRR